MHIDAIYVVGAGGHAKVVVDALLAAGVDAAHINILDSNTELEGSMLLGLPVATHAGYAGIGGCWFHVAIGEGRARRNVFEQIAANGGRPLTVIHPRALVSPFAKIGQGAFIAANAVVGPNATIGDAVIVNHGAVIDHDCEVAAFAHVAPNATLGGGVYVGSEALVGAGANILPAVRIGDCAMIGAGAVVLNNVTAAHTCVGVPAVSLGKE